MIDYAQVLKHGDLYCDEADCESWSGFDGYNFQSVVDMAQEDGWHIFKKGERWKHYCPEHNNPEIKRLEKEQK